MKLQGHVPPLSVLHCLFCSLRVEFLVLACPFLTARNARQAQFRLAFNLSCVRPQSIQLSARVQFPRVQCSEARPIFDKMCVQFSKNARPIFESERSPCHAQNGASNFRFFNPASNFFARPIFERARVQFFMLEKLTKMKSWTHC